MWFHFSYLAYPYLFILLLSNIPHACTFISQTLISTTSPPVGASADLVVNQTKSHKAIFLSSPLSSHRSHLLRAYWVCSKTPLSRALPFRSHQHTPRFGGSMPSRQLFQSPHLTFQPMSSLLCVCQHSASLQLGLSIHPWTHPMIPCRLTNNPESRLSRPTFTAPSSLFPPSLHPTGFLRQCSRTLSLSLLSRTLSPAKAQSSAFCWLLALSPTWWACAPRRRRTEAPAHRMPGLAKCLHLQGSEAGWRGPPRRHWGEGLAAREAAALSVSFRRHRGLCREERPAFPRQLSMMARAGTCLKTAFPPLVPGTAAAARGARRPAAGAALLIGAGVGSTARRLLIGCWLAVRGWTKLREREDMQKVTYCRFPLRY
jgi:hypothetical protein